jgi:RNA polymerase sigma-70 factor (ECF subfamily)
MLPLTPEEKRIAAAQQGDLDAFEELVRDYQGCVVTTAYHLLGSEADADDVSQEVWIRVYR